MSEIITIKNVRTYVDENNTAYLHIEDVARGLGLTTTQTIGDTEYVNVRWKTVNQYMEDIGFLQEVAKDGFIPENVFYRLAMKANNETARRFQAFIADEVLPAIRKHGAYMTPATIERALNDPDFLIRLATTLKEEKAARLKAEQERDLLLHTAKTYTTTEIAKELGMASAKALNKDLAAKGIQYKQNGTWVLYSRYSCMGYTDIKQTVLDNGHIVYDRKWTDAGRDFLLSQYVS